LLWLIRSGDGAGAAREQAVWLLWQTTFSRVGKNAEKIRSNKTLRKELAHRAEVSQSLLFNGLLVPTRGKGSIDSQ
jgi:hypothetical protein